MTVDGDQARIGEVLGQFELRGICGQGAMGTVYRAWQTGMERQVAIKILRADLVRDPKVVARFDREARAVAKLQHPNIVTFFTVGTTADGLPFLAMEYVEGPSLHETLAAERVLEAPRALHLARQVCAALAEAHAEGIVHRDLKPANILLTQKRRMPDFVKVLDFGIAKILRNEVDAAADLESRLTRTGAIFGTPHYIAPEQAAGGDVDGRADLYSLGVILYRSLTGSLPFDGAGIDVMLAHMSQPVPPPRSLAPDLDPDVEALLVRALEKEPEARFQSAEEMADALEALGARAPDASSREHSAPVPRVPRSSTSPVAAADRGPSASLQAGEAIDRAPPVGRRRAGWLALGALLVLGGGAAAVALGRRPAVLAADAPPAVARVAAPDAGAAAAEPELRPGYRIVTVGESGWAIRAQVPRDARAGQTYDLVFDVVDPDGSTTDDPELPATIEDPGQGRRSFLIPQVGTSGRYVLGQTFAAAGRYHVHLYPIPDQPKIHIWLDVIVKDENGRVPPEPPVRAAAHASAAQAAPVKPDAPPAAAPTPPVAEASPAGVADSDPYHIIEDKQPTLQPPPRTQPPRFHLIKRRRAPKPPNPDGLE